MARVTLSNAFHKTSTTTETGHKSPREVRLIRQSLCWQNMGDPSVRKCACGPQSILGTSGPQDHVAIDEVGDGSATIASLVDTRTLKAAHTKYLRQFTKVVVEPMTGLHIVRHGTGTVTWRITRGDAIRAANEFVRNQATEEFTS